jgi:two-component system, NtrC family, sensor kinase
MRLARKLTVALVAGILAVMAAYASFQVREEVVLSQADLTRASRIGRAWMGTIEAVWEHEGPARARELAARAMQRSQDITVRILPLAAGPTGSGDAWSADERQRLLAGAAVSRRYSDDAGNDWRQIYSALRVPDGEPAVVEYAEPMEADETFIKMSHRALAAATLAVVVACALIATGLEYAMVGRPLLLLRDKARRAGEGDFSAPLVLRQRDEMAELADDINAMCERIAEANRRLAEEAEARITALEQLRHTDRLATVGQLAAGIAHDLGTPLSVISARAQLLASPDSREADLAANARSIVEQCDRMTATIQQLLDYSRRRRTARTLADLRHIVTRTLGMLSTTAQKAGVELHADGLEAPLLARVDQNQIEQALINVALNGIQAMPRGGRLHVHLDVQRARPPASAGAQAVDCACITVDDEGAGIRPEHIERIFEPFFTTKDARDGTGLGLAVAHGIVVEHDGWITVDSQVGRGSHFAIFLPRAVDDAAAARGAA